MSTFVGINADLRYKDKLVELISSADIPARWRGTPIEHFIQAQNFGYPLHPQAHPQVLIVSCMEFRFSLPVPANYAYVIRTPGGRLIGAELAIGYVLHRGVTNILLIAHNDCGMTHLVELAPDIGKALMNQGWSAEVAEQFVRKHTAKLAVRDELEALEQEYHRLKRLFKKVHVAPLFLTLSDKRVYIPKWYQDYINSEPAEGNEHVSDEEVRKLY
jgi:carbonic anhydrase